MTAHETTGTEPKHTNRLIHETSPYLLQHAHNPVDWYPWGNEAFEAAKRENKPIFLSIGYSSCHWCHVMEHESFEDEEVARVLNDNFVSIKVDREERPDLDEIYMTAVQLLTQRGGWPMSTWLTPEGRPFHGGTYYPKPHFLQYLHNIAEVYRTRREEVDRNARNLTSYMEEVLSGAEPGEGRLTTALVENALSQMGSRFDETFGGFGSAPKFPPSTALPLLLHAYERHRRAEPVRIASKTLTAMALGGIHDHLGGGFHRYSTDRHWLLPHFEKMLYDNAQLSRVYADAWRITGRPEYRKVAEGTYDWVLREMTGEEGAFYSTLDADSEGVEGKFYVWEYSEILQILGPEDGELFCNVYNAKPEGNFREEATGEPTGLNILHLTQPLEDHAAAYSTGGGEADFLGRIAAMREQLLAVRVKRVWPGLDDKILTAWNGMMIGSFAHGGLALDRPDYVLAAQRAAEFILAEMRPDGRLLRSWRNGSGKLAGYLEDYSFMVHALLDLYEATDEERWLNEARALADTMIEFFWDEENGGFYNTASDHEEILIRTKSSFDQAMPSGNAVAVLGLMRLSECTGDPAYREHARETLEFFQGLMERNPMGAETMVRAAALYFEGAAERGEIQESAPAATGSAQSGPVAVRAELNPQSVPPGGRTTLRVTLEIAPGWHVNSHEPAQEYLEPTQVRVSAGEGITMGMVKAPPAKEVRLGFSEEPVSVYEGTVTWDVALQAAPDSPAGAVLVRVYLDYQACNDAQCDSPNTLMMETALEIRG
ncbi:MAG: DUF255 domain-containing protein [Armatimonadetes bacterium]|nr:DUF255 domain-containing protein [Armatimonadota bacterium]